MGLNVRRPRYSARRRNRPVRTVLQGRDLALAFTKTCNFQGATKSLAEQYAIRRLLFHLWMEENRFLPVRRQGVHGEMRLLVCVCRPALATPLRVVLHRALSHSPLQSVTTRLSSIDARRHSSVDKQCIKGWTRDLQKAPESYILTYSRRTGQRWFAGSQEGVYPSGNLKRRTQACSKMLSHNLTPGKYAGAPASQGRGSLPWLSRYAWLGACVDLQRSGLSFLSLLDLVLVLQCS